MEASQPSGSLLSRKIVIVSIIMYVASLILPCVFVSGQIFFGFSLLRMGWLGPLDGIIAWYANIFYLYALTKSLQKDALPYISPFIATSIAITFLFINRMATNAGGSQHLIDGYGIGFLLWLLSMPLLFISTVIKRYEATKGQICFMEFLHNGAIRAPMIPLLVLFTIVTFIWGSRWINSNPTEREELLKPVIVWQNICVQKNITPKHRIPINGPLEVAGRDHDGRMPESLSEPQLFLSWGIPVVRRDGYDFSLRDPSDIRTMQALKAKGESAASLRVSITDNILTAILSSQDGSLVAFDTTWEWTVMHKYCPELVDDPKPDQAPRSLVMASLILPNPTTLPTVSKNSGYLSEYPTQKVAAGNIRKETMKPAYEATLKSSQRECNANPQFNAKIRRGGRPVLIRDTYHFIDHPKPSLFCDEKNAYVYFVRGHTLIIHKRSMEDFRPLWDSILEVGVDVIHDLGGFKAEEMRPVTITESENKLHVTMGFKTVPPYTGFTGLQSFDVDLADVEPPDQGRLRPRPQ